MLHTAAGAHPLKDTFASMLRPGYDLRAPDFSYLMITELRDFYYNKYTLFAQCKETAIRVHRLLHHFYDTVQAHIANIHAHVDALDTAAHHHILPPIKHFFYDLSTNAFRTTKQLSDVNQVINPIQEQCTVPLNLQGFKDGPPSSQVRFLSLLTHLHSDTPHCLKKSIQIHNLQVSTLS